MQITENKVSQMTANLLEQTLGQLVAADIRNATIFKKHGLDFCCGGKKTVKQACIEKGIDVLTIEQELQHSDLIMASSRSLPYSDWPLDFLCDYVVNTHHSYVRKALPDIEAYAEKVCRVHGKNHPELIRIFSLVGDIATELNSHMSKEENVLFPYIKKLVSATNNKLSTQAGKFGSVKNPIQMMEMEHEMVGIALEEIRTLTNDYSYPPDACTSYKLLFKLLTEFEEDLHLHIHLENNIIFPRVIEMEKRLELL